MNRPMVEQWNPLQPAGAPLQSAFMIWAYTQRLDPLQGAVLGPAVWSILLAALPVLVLFWLLVPRRWLAPQAGAAGAATPIVVAGIVYRMPPDVAIRPFCGGPPFR